MVVLFVLLSLLVVLVAVLLGRALALKPEQATADTGDTTHVDLDRAVTSLQGAVRVPTISLNPEDDSTLTPFLQLHQYLEERYPLVFEHSEKTAVGGALMLKINGTDTGKLPVAFLSHLDVVPPQLEGWERDPFSGDVDEEFVYGRGTFDMKGQLIALLEGLESLLSQGKKPVRTTYCLFGCDEEVSGESAKAMCSLLEKQGVKLDFILDEGMTALDGSAIGVPNLALVGVCEKGYANIKVTAKGGAGHASMPPRETSVTVLADAIRKINTHPMKAYWSEPVEELIRLVAPHAKFPVRVVMANSWLFKPLLKPILCKIPSTNAMLRSTFALTLLEGSSAANVIPDRSSVTINCRLNTGESVDKVLAHLRKLVGKTCSVELLPLGYHEATAMSSTKTPVWQAIEKSVASTFPGGVSAPFPFPAGTDSKFYAPVCENIFKFSPHITSSEDRAVMHNVNEKLRLSAFQSDLEFYQVFLSNTAFSEDF